MSEMNSRESYTRYDEMTTDQLREILRKHAHGELEKEPDTEELFYIMEVLADRESENPEKQIKSTEEAYATFVKHYAPEMAVEEPIPFPKRSAIVSCWMKRVAVVAIVCVALTAAAVSAKAFAPDFWEKVAIWTREIFRFEDVTDGTEGKEPDKEVNSELNSLHDALSQRRITERLMPTWIPEGYVCTNVSIQETPKALRISAVYEKDGAQLVIQIRQELGSDPFQIEKNEELIEIYTVDGVDYYIFSNDKYLQTAWNVGEYECLIIGKLAMEEMKKAIDSI
jgi:hypothetical protein